ncbi:hypothetical protein A2U01_0081183 [Trifolium medium]|uniref:Uncharacterized protein n=1 Tax=Trifolium medium TaxID=97028 RepID=A0A392TFZ8_9FABA|nr:hypothetical protein [Trifolium medium]
MTALHESMYQLHLQGPVMTPPDFHTHNNWPGDRPPFGEGAGTSAGAGAEGDDDDDDDVDNAAAYAFEEDGDDDEMQDD